MTLTPPTGLDTEKESDEEAEDVSAEAADEGSDDITVEAAGDAMLDKSGVGDGSPVGTPAPELVEMAAEGAAHDEGHHTPEPITSELLESPSSLTETTRVTSSPLFPATDDEMGDASGEDDEVTVARASGDDLARPSVTEDEEEETKVETEETAIHAAAIRGDVETGLSEEASVQRDKALRKSSSEAEFSDPESDLDDEVVSAGPVLDEDDDGIEVGAHLAPKQRRVEDYSDDDSSMYGHSPGPSALVAALSARRPATPPTGTPVRTDGFGSARLPTPVPGFVSLPIIGAALPAPASSPFGKIAAVPAPYGSGRSTTSGPALQIPAPSGAAATAADGAGLFRKVPIPVGGLAAAGLSCIVAGVIIGWVARGGTPAAAGPVPTASTAPRVAPAPVGPPPGVHPVGAPPPAPPTAVAGAAPAVPAPAVAAPATAAPAAAPEPAASKPAASASEAERTGEAASRPAAKRVAAKRAKTDEEEALAPKQVASAKPLASKPTKPASKTGKKVWVDPFAD